MDRLVNPSVAILLSTFNGQRFVGEQIDSLLAQSYCNFRIFARDDGSCDGTLAVLDRYSAMGRIELLEDHAGNLGCTGSFLRLLAAVDADIYMFCDQDDVWSPGKIAEAVAAIGSDGLHRPVLFHTDLQIVDEALALVSQSFFEHEKIRLPRAHALGSLVVQNCVVGCTTVITDPLKRKVLEAAEHTAQIAMHDWWIALVAHCFGEIIFSASQPIMYRQHGSNLSGVRSSSLSQKIAAQFSAAGVERISTYQRRISDQSAEFLAVYGSSLDVRTKTTFWLAARLGTWARVPAWIACLLWGVRFQNVYMNFSFLFNPIIDLLIWRDRK